MLATTGGSAGAAAAAAAAGSAVFMADAMGAGAAGAGAAALEVESTVGTLPREERALEVKLPATMAGGLPALSAEAPFATVEE